jgi:hypothetical protein
MSELKRHHHYVPQFWIRLFAVPNGHVHAWDGKTVRVISSRNVMQEECLYTTFFGFIGTIKRSRK